MVLSITELASTLGLSSDTLRYYERSGLISSAGRTAGGYRLYAEPEMERVRFIRSAQRSGLRLREIAELLAIMDAGNCPCGHTIALVDQRIAEVDDEIRHLQALRSNLRGLQDDNFACKDSSATTWFCQITDRSRGGEAS